MKRAYFIAVVLSLATISQGNASPDNWTFFLSDQRTSSTVVSFGVAPAGADGYDLAGDWVRCGFPPTVAGIAQYLVNGEGWDGPTGWMSMNIYSMFGPNETKTWGNLYCWVYPDWEFDRLHDVQLSVMPFPDPQAQPPLDWKYRLYLDYVPAGVSYAGPWEWNIDPSATTTVSLPAYRSTIGTDGLRLHISVTSTPEPSAFVALAVGLPLVAMRGRRR